MRTAGAGAAASLLGSPIARATGLFDDAPKITDEDILNFALNLEYLEAEYYTYAVMGHGIDSINIGIDGVGTAGATTGGRAVNFTDPRLRKIAEELAYDEQQHVILLRKVLGKKAIAKPAIKLDALGIGFASDAEYLTIARAFEDTGVSAYAGAAPLLKNKIIIGTAAGILADEAYHMGNVRLMIAMKEIRVPRLDARDILPPPAGDKLFALDQDGLSVTRTPAEVVAIAAPFFPNGINGNLQPTMMNKGGK